MFFSDILDIHDGCEPEGSHRDILGDGFLIENNRIYRNVKAFSLQIGCEYVEAYPEYLLLPFQELPKIVASKRVPYVPGARLMKAVEQDRPGVFASEDLPMPESYHLHEAAHVIAEYFLGKIKASTPQEEILQAMLAESFANTVDAMACIAVADEVHYFFLKQNCYMHPQKKVGQALAALIESLGFRFTFMLTLLTYLQANFLARPLGKKAIDGLTDRYAKGGKIGAKVQKHIRTVCAIGEKLDPNFRVTTTGNYLKQRGFDGEIHDLLDFPFMKVFAANRRLCEATEALSDIFG